MGDRIFLMLGGILGLAGLWMLYFAFLRDRSRGRRRCPQCWYDMSGTNSLTCSECGRVAKSERQLLKTRRRWRCAAVAIVIMSLVPAHSAYQHYRDVGWSAAIPIEVLLWAADTLHSDWALSEFEERSNSYGGCFGVPDHCRISDAQWHRAAHICCSRLEREPSNRGRSSAIDVLWHMAVVFDDTAAFDRARLNRAAGHCSEFVRSRSGPCPLHSDDRG